MAYLRTHTDFVTYDRLAFLVDHPEPTARALDALRRAVGATAEMSSSIDGAARTVGSDESSARLFGRTFGDTAKNPVTTPYRHHGAFSSLDQVLQFYDVGGGRGAGAPIDNQTLAADSLHLTVGERTAVRAFLGSLTDAVGLGPRKP